MFLTFALAYLISALLRAITATLSPTLSAELALSASDLGLLAGGYFFGFALMQLPLGTWLDAYGPRRVSVAFLSVAVVGCVAFALATSFPGLLVARVLIGMGVSACLMAPLTGYRRWFTPAALLRANSWMLMTGSMGMVAATLPVQWLVPLVGWRGLFWGLAGLVAVSMVLLAWQVPAWRRPARAHDAPQVGYRQVAQHPYFRQMVAIGFFNYGGMVAVQTLWAAPWMVRVAGYSPQDSALGLFAINLCMLTVVLDLGPGESASGSPRCGAGAADSLGAAGQPGGAGVHRRHGPGRGLADVGLVLCQQHRGFAVPAGGGAGAAARGRWPCAVGLQSGDFCGHFCGAVGHWLAGGRRRIPGLGHGRELPGCDRRVWLAGQPGPTWASGVVNAVCNGWRHCPKLQNI